MSMLREIMAWAWSGSHAGVPTPLDWVMVVLASTMVAYAFYKALRHTLRPGERDRSHIKGRILEEDERQP